MAKSISDFSEFFTKYNNNIIPIETISLYYQVYRHLSLLKKYTDLQLIPVENSNFYCYLRGKKHVDDEYQYFIAFSSSGDINIDSLVTLSKILNNNNYFFCSIVDSSGVSFYKMTLPNSLHSIAKIYPKTNQEV